MNNPKTARTITTVIPGYLSLPPRKRGAGIQEKDLPEGWVSTTLGEISSYIQRGKSPKYTDFSELPVVNQKCIRWNGIDREHLKYIHPDQFEKWEEKRFLKEGDLLWNSTGTGTIGRAAIVHLREGEKLVADSHVTIVRPGEGIQPKYVHYWVMSPAVQNSIEAMQSGSTNQVELSKGEVESTPIPLAPPEQQKRIVAKIEELFSHIDAGIDALKKAKQLLKQYRQSVLKGAVTGELTKEWCEANKDKLEPVSKLLERILKERRQLWEEQQIEQFKVKGKIPKDDKWKDKYKEPCKPTGVGAEYPHMWTWVTWDQVGFSQNGRVFPSNEYNNSGFKLLRPGNLHISGKVEWTEKNTKKLPQSWADEFPNYIVYGNELVMNLTAQSLADEFLGRVCLTQENETCLLNQRIARLTPIQIEAKYLLYLFKSKLFRTFVEGLNTGSLIQHMYTTQLQEFELPLPPVYEQQEIVKSVEKKFSTIEHVEKTLDEQLARSMLNKQLVLALAFKGDI